MDIVVRNVCWLSPPEPPIFENTPLDAKKRMLNIQQSCSAYNYYAEHCLGKGNGTFTASPEPNSTPSPTTFVSMVTSSPVLTTEFTNISSQQNNTLIRPKPELIDLTTDSGSSVVVPVVITLIIILILAATTVVAVWFIKKKKGSAGYGLFIRVQKFLYKDPSIKRNRESSSSSNGSKKSRNNSVASESGVPNKVVTSSQVLMNEKDFKHASTAQLIDETSIISEYENPMFGPVMEECESFTVKIEMEQKEISDTQTDSDLQKSNSISPNHKALNSSDYSDTENDPPYDTPPKWNLKKEQRDQSEDGRDLHLSMEGGGGETSETEKALRWEGIKGGGGETSETEKALRWEGIKGGGGETSVTEKAMEDLKPDLNIDQNSNTEVSAMDRGSVIKNQLSIDCG